MTRHESDCPALVGGRTCRCVRNDPTPVENPLSAPTPPPERNDPTPVEHHHPRHLCLYPAGCTGCAEPSLAEQARHVQQLYSNWLNNDSGNDVDVALRLDDFLNAACDLLERITGQSIPRAGYRPPHGTQEMFDFGCRCDACKLAGATTPPPERNDPTPVETVECTVCGRGRRIDMIDPNGVCTHCRRKGLG